LQRIVILGDLLVASCPNDEGNSDIRRGRELKGSSSEINAIASGNGPQLFALFDRCQGDIEVLLAVVVTRTPGYEACVERGPYDERNVLLADSGQEFVHRVGMIDQRILPGAKTDIGIGVIHNLEDGEWGVNADAQARMVPSSRIFDSAGNAPLRAISYCSSQPFGK